MKICVHKGRPQSGGGKFLQSSEVRGGVLQMRTTALFGAKNSGFFEVYGVRTDKGGGD